MEPLSNIRTGLLFLVLCCGFYLAWWSVTFNPLKTFPALPKYVLFIGIAAAGVYGGKCLFPALGELSQVRSSIPAGTICLVGLAVYLLLFFVTGFFLHRQVTTELLLITGWAVLELCLLARLYGAEAVTLPAAVIMAAVALAAAAVSMVCYLLYYQLDPVPRFYDGMVPLVLAGLVMAIQAVLLRG